MDLEFEVDVDWVRDPHGRRGQIERHFHTAEARARQIAKTVHGKGQAIARLEDENHQQVRSAAGKAYRAIEDVVTTLLTIEDGNQRLSRANASIMQGLQDSVKNFESLCAISRENKDELGVKAGDCKELGDGAGRLVRALAGKAAGLNIDARAAWGFRGDHERTRQMHSGDEANLRSRCDEKRWAINDPGNQFLGMFDGGLRDRLGRELSEAEDRLNKNLESQRQAQAASERYYQLAVFAKNASSAFMALKQRLGFVVTDFAEMFVRVVEAQNVEVELWTGLLDLKDKIWSTEYVSTRDHSLRQLLRLLTLDDNVFMRQEFFENTEVRIKNAIETELGVEALKRLMEPEDEPVFDDELNNI